MRRGRRASRRGNRRLLRRGSRVGFDLFAYWHGHSIGINSSATLLTCSLLLCVQCCTETSPQMRYRIKYNPCRIVKILCLLCHPVHTVETWEARLPPPFLSSSLRSNVLQSRSTLALPLYPCDILLRYGVPRTHVFLHAAREARFFAFGQRGVGFGDAALEAMLIEFLIQS